MKRQFIKIAAIAIGVTMALSASAQMKIYHNGHVRVGNAPETIQSGSSPGNNIIIGGVGEVVSEVDTTATLSVMGKGVNWSGGRIAFGGRKDVWIGESSFDSSYTGTVLNLQGVGGFSLKSGTKKLLEYYPHLYTVDNGATLNAGVSIQAPQYLTTSDSRLKSNISSLEEIGELVGSLTPVSYTYKEEGQEGDNVSGKGKMRSAAGDSGHRIYGFLAQEVREILPDLVYEDSEGMLSIDYQGFIPVLVDAVKGLRNEATDLRRTIEEQQAKIERLENGGRSIGENIGEEGATLSQNRPNPFRVETEIQCHLPQDVSEAFICIYDLNGNQKQRITLTDRGDVTVTVTANSLPAGLYLYSLIADGMEVDSKRMILTD